MHIYSAILAPQATGGAPRQSVMRCTAACYLLAEPKDACADTTAKQLVAEPHQTFADPLRTPWLRRLRADATALSPCIPTRKRKKQKDLKSIKIN